MNEQTRTGSLPQQTKRAQGGVGAPHLHHGGPDGDVRAAGLEPADAARPGSQAESVTPGVDETERQTITSGIAQTSEVADRDAQDAAEGERQGTPRGR